MGRGGDGGGRGGRGSDGGGRKHSGKFGQIVIHTQIKIQAANNINYICVLKKNNVMVYL